MSATRIEELTTTPPCVVSAPESQTCPVVFASAHSGRAYSPAFLADSRLDPLTLRRSEDSFVDELFAAAPQHGAPLLAATFPRAWCDANRGPWELDPTMFADRLPERCGAPTPRARAGFGVVARIVADGAPIYRRKLRFSEAELRVATCWQPYHRTLATLIDRTRARFGWCLVIDCHSMPTERTRGRPAASFVLGDAHGVSCAPGITTHVETWLHGRGHAVRRNDPYAGGYVTRHYGRPADGVHVLQLEIARSLYMDEARVARLDSFVAVKAEVTALIQELTTLRPA